MTSEEIRKSFLAFFEKRGHAIISSSSLVPEHDPSVLFITAGMQPLLPYLMGEKHPQGNKLVSVQKCIRTQDIEEVGDKTHVTFFEMLGNWSLGDLDSPDGIGTGYFKEDAIKMSYEFLTSKIEDIGLGLDSNRLYITCFEGDEDAPRDNESAEIWRKIGIPENRIFFFGKKENWWSLGDNGPCGPDTEMFYDIVGNLNLKNKNEFLAADERQEIIEIWNDVFMEYEKRGGKVIGKLKQKNVDTGAGLERLSMVMQEKDDIFKTDLFEPLIKKIELFTNIDAIHVKQGKEKKAKYIVADHIRTSVFIIADGVIPGNTDRGYVLRRLLRRTIRYANMLGIKTENLVSLADVVIEKYKNIYENVGENQEKIKEEIRKEEEIFRSCLQRGLKEFEKISTGGISGKDAFVLFSTYGFPLEMTTELAEEKGVKVDVSGFEIEMEKHQNISRSGAEQKFKGGLADHSEISVKYHTATHLLQSALKIVLGDHVLQKGSNITKERLRFDFAHSKKMTDEEKEKVEDLVNQKIKDALPVSYEDIPIEKAEKLGALGLFEEKYTEKVRVYKISDPSIGSGQVFSLEYCGGPHVENTKVLGHFKIKKEEAVSAGVRRIKAILE